MIDNLLAQTLRQELFSVRIGVNCSISLCREVVNAALRQQSTRLDMNHVRVGSGPVPVIPRPSHPYHDDDAGISRVVYVRPLLS